MNWKVRIGPWLLLALLTLGLLTFLLPSNATAGDLGFAEIAPLERESLSPGLEYEFEAVDHSEVALYMWNFGDGSDIQLGRVVNHTFDEYGSFIVKLMCLDGAGRWDNDTLKVMVKGFLYSNDIAVQVCCTILCVTPILVPFLILIGLAMGSRFLLQRFTKRDWSVRSLVMFGLFIVCIPIYFILSIFALFIPIGTLIVNMIIGSGLWLLVGFIAVFLIGLTVKVLSKIKFFGLKDGLCIVRKPLPIQKKQVQGKMRFSKKNYMDFVLELSLYPLFLAFFLMSIVTMDVSEPGDFITWQNFAIVAFAPFVTFIIIPVQILLDSNLLFVRKDPRTGIFIVYLGASVRNLMQGLLGIGAIAAFMGIFLNFGSGAELEQALWGLFFLALIIVMIFPNIFLVACIYGLLHNKFVKMTNDRLDKLDLPEYRIMEHKVDKRYVAMVPIKYQTWTLQKIETDLDVEGAPIPLGQQPPPESTTGNRPK